MNDDPRQDVVLFAQALQLAASQRSAFLERACRNDPKLRERVEGLLRAHDSAGDFLERPPPNGIASGSRA
jgi:serine/threonine-protein kinase